MNPKSAEFIRRRDIARAALRENPHRSNSSIGATAGLSPKTVMKLRIELEDAKEIVLVRRAQAEPEETRIAQIKSLISRGFNAAQIAKELGVSEDHVRGLVNRNRDVVKPPPTLVARNATRSVNAARIVQGTVDSLVALAHGIENIKAASLEVEPADAEHMLKECRNAIRSVNWLLSKLREFACEMPSSKSAGTEQQVS